MRVKISIAPLLLLLAAAGTAQAGALVKIDDDTFFSVGAQIQPAMRLSFDGANQAPSGNFGTDFYLRRVRLLTSGQITKPVTFAFGIDMPNLGQKGDFSTAKQFLVHEAYVSYQFMENMYVDMGFFLVPWSRASIISTAQLHTLETRAPVLTLFGADKGSRETGVQYRAILMDKKLNMRFAITNGIEGVNVSGKPPTNGNDRPAFWGRVAYTFFGNESGFAIPGIQFSETPILSFGVAGGYQNSASFNVNCPDGTSGATATCTTAGATANVYGMTGDAHLEYPFSKDMAVLIDAGAYKTFAGDGDPRTALAFHAEAGFRYDSLEPVVAWEYMDTDDVLAGSLATAPVKNKSGYRAVHFGLNWWVMKHKFNIKGDFALIRAGRIGQANATAQYNDKVAIIQSQIFF